MALIARENGTYCQGNVYRMAAPDTLPLWNKVGIPLTGQSRQHLLLCAYFLISLLAGSSVRTCACALCALGGDKESPKRWQQVVMSAKAYIVLHSHKAFLQ